MNIPRVQNYSPTFKSALPIYRVEPFGDYLTAVRVGVNPVKETPPDLVLHQYSQPETVTMNNGVIARYDYPLSARKNTTYTLMLPDNNTTYTCYGDRMMNTAIREIQRKHNLPDILSEKDGKVIGKIVNNIPLNLPDSLNFITEPTIIVAHEEIIYGIENPNVVAIIAAPGTG